MHDLPHCITTPMHQCMFISICMFMAFKQSKTLISIKKNKKKKANKTKRQILKDMKNEVKQRLNK